MKIDYKKVLLILAATTVGLSAGLLFSYQVSVVPAFKMLSDVEYVAAMKALIVGIQNPIFFSCYLGAVVFLLATVYAHRGNPAPLRFKQLLVATALYLVTIGITMGANVPLNNKLDAFSLKSATPAQVHKARVQFESPWNNWHLIRTLTATGSLVVIVLACLSSDDHKRQRA